LPPQFTQQQFVFVQGRLENLELSDFFRFETTINVLIERSFEVIAQRLSYSLNAKIVGKLCKRNILLFP
jgi:hypothetical protein